MKQLCRFHHNWHLFITRRVTFSQDPLTLKYEEQNICANSDSASTIMKHTRMETFFPYKTMSQHEEHSTATVIIEMLRIVL